MNIMKVLPLQSPQVEGQLLAIQVPLHGSIPGFEQSSVPQLIPAPEASPPGQHVTQSEQLA